MFVSHEVPISLLEESKNFNDYDYCLVHLLDIPEYKQYYMNSVKEGRKVLLDNSLFELETKFDNDVFANKILELRPTEYIVPDSLENKDETISSFENFISKYKDLPGIKIGVVQGKTLEDIIECYKYMSEHADKIALSFDLSYYEQTNPNENKLFSWCYGRQQLVKYLIENDIWNPFKPHHLLGCGLAREFDFNYYKSHIESIDTSNPIVAAINGYRYSDNGLFVKPKIKLCDLINYKLNDEQLDLVRHNTKIFKQIIGR